MSKRSPRPSPGSEPDASNGTLRHDIAARRQAKHERRAHLWFLESMDQVNRAMQGTNDLEQMLGDVLDVVLTIFDCDRAWLLYPCDPDTTSWRVPMERTRPEYPGAGVLGIDLPTDPDIIDVFRAARAADGPVKFGPGSGPPVPAGVVQRFRVQSQITMAIYPKVDKPYMFGLHQCSYPRIWTPQEERLFQEIGRRLADGLTSLLVYRNLRESHSLLRAVVEGTSDAVFVKDLQGRYLMINAAGAHFLGRTVEEVVGQDDRALFSPDAARAIMERDRQVMASGALQMFEETRTAAGVTRTYLTTKGVYRDAQGQVIGLIGISRDVTALKRLEEQVRQAQKLEAVGRLAGGVAHDFNNLLAVIVSYADLLLDNLEPGDQRREDGEQIRKAAEAAANLTRQLLAFSRQQVLQAKPLDLRAVVAGAEKLLKRMIGGDIELVTMLGRDVGAVEADAGQLEQVIMNLTLNARDAMPGGGMLTIEVASVELDEDDVRSHPQARPGRYARLTVRDTGIGMDEEIRAHIFEPFFTTKEVGRGTGLGLATVYGIVTQLSGFIQVDSERGRGTTFTIYLPCVGVAA